MNLKILTYPNEILDKKTEPVVDLDDNLIKFIHAMFDAMYDSNGVGLAANQVGLSKSIFVFDCSEDSDRPQCMINPMITSSSGLVTHREGCLSFPGIDLAVPRSQRVTVKYMDINGGYLVNTFKDIDAVCIQHEIDHLNGSTFLNRVNRSTRRSTLKTLRRKK